MREFGKDDLRTFSTSPRTSKPAKFDHEDIKRKMRFDYSYSLKDDTMKALSALDPILSKCREREFDLRSALEEVANLISRQFRIREVCIGLRSPADGMFRYEIFVGFREDAIKRHKELAYTREEFGNSTKYPGTPISRYTRVYLAEDSPYKEDETNSYNRPVLLGSMKRATPEDSIEGDYIDIIIPGPGDEMLGWIEMSGTTGGKLLDVTTIKWIELIACVLGTVMCSRSQR